MQKIDDPRPVHQISDSIVVDWPVNYWVELPKISTVVSADIFGLLDIRQSRRQFGKLGVTEVANLFWHTQRCTGIDRVNDDRSFRPYATAGALACVRTIVVNHCLGTWVYDGFGHRAGILSVEHESIEYVTNCAQEFFDTGEGSILLFLANRSHIENHYANPESLVLRESGILMGLIAIISEALGLAFCPLGTQARDWSASILGVSEDCIVPGGAALIGAR